MDRNNQRTVCLQREKRYVEAVSTFSFRSSFIAGQSRVGDLQRLVRNYLDSTRNGLAKYNQRTDNFTGYISEDTSFGRPACNEIISLMESSQGVLWAGTWYGGLTRFNKETGQFRYYFGEGDTLTIPRIRTLFQRTANSFYSRLRRRTLYIQHHDRRMSAYRRRTK